MKRVTSMKNVVSMLRNARAKKAYEAERALMRSRGFREHETDMEIVRGGHNDGRIVEAVISQDGKRVWTKVVCSRYPNGLVEMEERERQRREHEIMAQQYKYRSADDGSDWKNWPWQLRP